MDDSHYTPSAVTRLLAPALMLALATWLLADGQPDASSDEQASVRSTDASEVRSPAGSQAARAAGADTSVGQLASNQAPRP